MRHKLVQWPLAKLIWSSVTLNFQTVGWVIAAKYEKKYESMKKKIVSSMKNDKLSFGFWNAIRDFSSGLRARNTVVRSLRTGSRWSPFASPLRSPNAFSSSSSSSLLSTLLTSHRGVIALRINQPSDQRPEWSLLYHPLATNLRVEIEKYSRHQKRTFSERRETDF